MAFTEERIKDTNRIEKKRTNKKSPEIYRIDKGQIEMDRTIKE